MKKIKILCLATLASWQVKAQNPTLILGSNYYKVGTGIVALPQQPLYDGGYIGNNNNIVQPNSYTPVNMYPKADNTPLFFIGENASNTNSSLNLNPHENLHQAVFNSNGFLIAELHFTQNPLAYTDYGAGYTFPLETGNGIGETCIVPEPGNCNRYYIFTSGYTRKDYSSINPQTHDYFEPFFGIVDMSLPTNWASNPINELGRMVTPGQSNKTGNGESTLKGLFDTDITPIDVSGGIVIGGESAFRGDIHYAASKPISNLGGDRLLFVSTNVQIIIYRISPTGINFLKSYDYGQFMNYGGTYGSPLQYGLANSGLIVSELELFVDIANNKIKLAIPAPKSGSTTSGNNVQPAILLNEFDYNGNNIPNSSKVITLTNHQSLNNSTYNVSGIEFSPDGNWVYYTKGANIANGNNLEAVNYNNPNNRIAFLPSGVNMSDFAHSQIELGKDGKMYLATYNRMATIINPNSPSVANFQNNTLALSNYFIYNGNDYITNNTKPTYLLPDQIDGDAYNRYPVTVDAIDNQTICLGSCINLTLNELPFGVSAPAGVYTWSTNINGAYVSVGTGTTVNVCPNVTTTYILTYKNKQGCEAQDMVTITVVAPPDPKFSYTQIIGSTYNNITAFANNLAGSTVAGFQEKWQIETLDAAGNVIANTALGTNPNPTCWVNNPGTTNFPGFIGGSNVSCANLSPGVFAKNTNYLLTRYVQNAYCSWTSHTVPVYSAQRLMNNSTTKKLDKISIESLNIFPNPSSGLININFDNAIDTKYDIEVFDIYGKSVFKTDKQNTTGTDFKTEINLSDLNLANGLYLINIKSKNQKSSQRIVIEK